MPHWHYTDRWQHRLQLTETDVNAAAPLTCQQFFPFFSLSIHFFSPILRLPRALTDFSCTLFFSPCRLGLTRLFICTSFVFGRVCVCVCWWHYWLMSFHQFSYACLHCLQRHQCHACMRRLVHEHDSFWSFCRRLSVLVQTIRHRIDV